MKEIAENAAAAAAAHCALHLDCFKTFPHHDIPPGSHCTLCTVLYCTVLYCTLCYSRQPPTHLSCCGSDRNSALKSSIRRFVITEKAPTRAFSWFKAATTTFTLRTLLRHYSKQALTPRSLNVKLGPRRKGHKGRAVWLA